MPVALAPLEEHREIIRITNTATDLIASILEMQTSMNSSLAQLDQSILAKAFRGELVPQDPNDEPASELLARIRAAREQAKATTKKKSKTKRKTASSK